MASCAVIPTSSTPSQLSFAVAMESFGAVVEAGLFVHRHTTRLGVEQHGRQ